MRFVRASVEEVIGLFVADWTQSLTTVVILGVGWFALPHLHVGGVAFVLAVALGVQLVIATLADARRQARRAAGH